MYSGLIIFNSQRKEFYGHISNTIDHKILLMVSALKPIPLTNIGE